MNFDYSKITWLVVSGNQAWLKGEGNNVVNGVNEACYFLVSVVDNGATADKFRVKIWNKATGTVIYDNQKASSDPNSASAADTATDRKSTRLNSSHITISYAVF